MKLIDEEMRKISQRIESLFGPEMHFGSPPARPELLKVIRAAMLNYAVAAMIDSDIRKEIDEEIAENKSSG